MTTKGKNPFISKSAFLERRVEPVELLSEQFDSHEPEVTKRLVIFAQPRTASFTLCRYFAAAGWGLPNEYFSAEIMLPLFERYLGYAFGAGHPRECIAQYATQVESHRSRHGTFAVKVMWSEISRFQMAYGSGGMSFAPAMVYLRRADFASQVISFAFQQKTGIYSFSAQHLWDDKNGAIIDADMIRRTGEYLIKEEGRWFDYFGRFGLRPVILDYEDVVKNPLSLMDSLSLRFGLAYDKADVLRCASHEKDGRYENQRLDKDELREKHLPLLGQLSEARSRQFADIKSKFGIAAS